MMIHGRHAKFAAGHRNGVFGWLVLVSLVLCASVATGEGDESEPTARTIRVRRDGTSTDAGRIRATIRAKRVSISTASLTLGEVLQQLAREAGLQIEIEPSAKPALARKVLGQRAWKRVEFASVIDSLLLLPGLAWGVRDGKVIVAREGEIDPKDDPDLEVRRYDVGPLLRRTSKEALLSILRSFVWPPDATSSDRPRLELGESWLVARQEERTHVVLEGFLNCLLNGGGNPTPRSNARRELEKALDRRVSVDFARTHHVDVAEHLAHLLDQTVLSFPADDKLDSVVTLRMKDASIREVLRRFARALNCYVDTNDYGVNILSEPSTDLRLHPVGDVERPASAIDAVMKAIDDDSWSVVPRPVLWNDLLIVRQTEENLEKIEAALKALRESRLAVR